MAVGQKVGPFAGPLHGWKWKSKGCPFLGCWLAVMERKTDQNTDKLGGAYLFAHSSYWACSHCGVAEGHFDCEPTPISAASTEPSAGGNRRKTFGLRFPRRVAGGSLSRLGRKAFCWWWGWKHRVSFCRLLRSFPRLF